MYTLKSISLRRGQLRDSIFDACLHEPDGSELWIDSDEITGIHVDKDTGHSRLRLREERFNRSIVVTETVSEIRSMRRNAGVEDEVALQEAALAEILEAYPHLGPVGPRAEGYPRAELELAFACLWHINPRLMQNPLAGGTLLGQVLCSRDTFYPAAMRLDIALAVEMSRCRPE